MTIQNKPTKNNKKIIKKLMLVLVGLIAVTVSACSSRPFGYILSPLETSAASGWTSTPKPTPTNTPYPTLTQMPTNTPLPTATDVPTQSLPLDATVYIKNQLSVNLHITCGGPYQLDFDVSGFETKTIYVPAGTYSCTIYASGYNTLFKTQYWTAGTWDWTFYSQ